MDGAQALDQIKELLAVGSDAAVATAFGVTRSGVSNWRCGHAKVPRQRIDQAIMTAIEAGRTGQITDELLEEASPSTRELVRLRRSDAAD